MRVSEALAVALTLGFGWACGGAVPAKTTPEPSVQAAGREQAHSEADLPKRRSVQVQGLEGTLQAYDVRQAMEERLDALARCQEARIRHLRALSGSVELAIHVLADGKVSHVNVIRSDVGDLATEQCIATVTRETMFPPPHGGEADVKWSMTLDPLSPRPAAEPLEPDQFAEEYELLLPDTAEHCQIPPRTAPLTVTAYVAPSGKILAAGVASPTLGLDELKACVARDVTDNWKLPKARRIRKASFEARYRHPLTDAQRKSIRDKHARRRKAEAKQRQAERRRRRKRSRS